MAQVGCRRSVACLSFRSMADLGYYYSPMEGDHLTTTGHTGVPAGFQGRWRNAVKNSLGKGTMTGWQPRPLFSTGKLFQQTDGSLIRLKTGICSTLRSNQLDYTASALHTHNNNNNTINIMLYPGYIGYDQFFDKIEWGTICRLQSELDKANVVIQEDSAKLLMGCLVQVCIIIFPKDGCQFLTVDDESLFILPRQRSVPVDGLETTTTRHTCDAIAVRKAYFAVQAG
ncbi:hypothetical protein T10_7293 [Trichinella papuae]|uniref:Uncharacterized protein n=1 Tax=Trichinella papuae TaxID=268474 RepID=A0A0V1N6L6_9BILA|nr:hypothetical protein T10_7293 [Trichinella papuae]